MGVSSIGCDLKGRACKGHGDIDTSCCWFSQADYTVDDLRLILKDVYGLTPAAIIRNLNTATVSVVHAISDGDRPACNFSSLSLPGRLVTMSCQLPLLTPAAIHYQQPRQLRRLGTIVV
jgi:hypothetical protein